MSITSGYRSWLTFGFVPTAVGGVISFSTINARILALNTLIDTMLIRRELEKVPAASATGHNTNQNYRRLVCSEIDFEPAFLTGW